MEWALLLALLFADGPLENTRMFCCLSWWNTLQQDTTPHIAEPSAQNKKRNLFRGAAKDARWQILKEPDTSRKTETTKEMVAVQGEVYICCLPLHAANSSSLNKLSFMWNDRQLMANTEESTHQHLPLSLIVLGQAFILFFSVVIFTVRRWGFSINNSFCFLSLLWLFFLCRSFALTQGDSHFSSSPIHHTINLSAPCSNFLLHPVITVRRRGRSRSLYAGSLLLPICFSISAF